MSVCSSPHTILILNPSHNLIHPSIAYNFQAHALRLWFHHIVFEAPYAGLKTIVFVFVGFLCMVHLIQ